MHTAGYHFWVENPDSSFSWQQKEWQNLPEGTASRFYKCDYCTFKTPWRKRTRFVTNNRLAGLKRLCKRDRKHILLRGRAKGQKASWTKLAEPYPRALCSVLAHASCSDLGLYNGPTTLCCRCAHRRIGEAKNPGPRKKDTRLKDPLDLDNVEPLSIFREPGLLRKGTCKMLGAWSLSGKSWNQWSAGVRCHVLWWRLCAACVCIGAGYESQV